LDSSENDESDSHSEKRNHLRISIFAPTWR
jgi:hypothetical protein